MPQVTSPFHISCCGALRQAIPGDGCRKRKRTRGLVARQLGPMTCSHVVTGREMACYLGRITLTRYQKFSQAQVKGGKAVSNNDQRGLTDRVVQGLEPHAPLSTPG